jgi:hypothetical protein
MKRVHGVIRIARVLTLIGVFTLLANSQSKAQLLNVQPVQVNGGNAPDFYMQYLTVSYTAASGLFQATGDYYASDSSENYANDYTDPSGNIDAVSGSSFPADFNLTAYITSAGVLTNGTLTIAGDITAADGPYTTLLTGTLTTGLEGTAFGATNDIETASTFNFLFTVTGGTLANDYHGVGAPDGFIAVYPDGGSTFSGSWASDFADTPGNGYGAVDVVPEPSSFLLLMFAGALCAAATILRRPRRRDPQVVQG